MITDFENTPAVIFDWINTLSFAALNDAQQKEVLRYFSKEDYEDMHTASQSLKAVYEIKTHRRISNRKDQLLEKFDQHYADKKIIPLFSKSLIAWQAASVLLFLVAGWLFFKVSDLKKSSLTKQVASVDTVYVDREVRSTTERIHDTVYLYKQQESGQAQSNAGKQTVAKKEQMISEEIYVVPLNETTSREPHGTSMRDDSLLRKFNFVSL